MGGNAGDQQSLSIAPMPELVRSMYLMFHGLISIRNYGLVGSREELEYCGFLAEALQDLPDRLLHYSAERQTEFWRRAGGLGAQAPPAYAGDWTALIRRADELSPESMLSWQLRSSVRAPLMRRAARCVRRLMGRETARAARWGTERDVDLAPLAVLARYLRLVADGLGAIGEAAREQGDDDARFCGYLADSLHNLPDLLLRFSEFDQREFWRYAGSCRARVSPRFLGRWDAVFPPGDLIVGSA